jgi:hypothetical protein
MTIGFVMWVAVRSAERSYRPGPGTSEAFGAGFTTALPAFHEDRRAEGRRP